MIDASSVLPDIAGLLPGPYYQVLLLFLYLSSGIILKYSADAERVLCGVPESEVLLKTRPHNTVKRFIIGYPRSKIY